MELTVENIAKTILKHKKKFSENKKDSFYIALEGTFDDAPLGVDVYVCIVGEKEGNLYWLAQVHPLVGITDEIEGPTLMPDFGRTLLTFNFFFTNPQKTKLGVHIFFSE